MGFSQLVPDGFETLYDRKFTNSHVLALQLHDASHHLAIQIVALGLTNIRTTLHNVV